MAAFPGANGKIAFVHRDATLIDRIVVIDPDGTDETRLTAGFGTDPSFSADGTKIVFRTASGIAVMNADGSGVTSTGVIGIDPSFSPDGSKIAYWTGSQIAVMNADGTSPTVLTTSGYGGDPAFSPDGTTIAYADFSGIWRIDADGTDKVSLFTPAGRTAVAPNWSPDGSKIAFASDRDSGFGEINEVFVMNANGTDVQRLTTQNPSGYVSHTSPAFSPDGTKIVFSRGAGGLVVMNADGSAQTTLATTAIHTAGTDWQPLVTVAASSNLGLAASDSPDPVAVGANLTYTLTVSNAGPDAAAAVDVTDVLPAGVTFVSASSSQGSCSGTSTVTCALGTLANGATATVTIVVRPAAAGALTNTASVSSATADPSAADNSATAATTVESAESPPPETTSTTTEAPPPPPPPAADLTVAVVGMRGTAALHGYVSFDVVVANRGTLAATGVVLLAPIPPTVDLVAARLSGQDAHGSNVNAPCSSAGGVVRCGLGETVGTLAAGSRALATITYEVQNLGTVVQSVSAAANEADANPADNSATTSVPVRRFSIVERVLSPTGFPDVAAIRFTAAEGERNDLAIEVRSDHLLITDRVSELRTSPKHTACTLLSPHQARCAKGSAGSNGRALLVRTGDHDDRIELTGSVWSDVARTVLDGGDGDDLIGGGPGAETLRGGNGDDTLDGRGGDDVVRSGPGRDIVLGGPGADLLVPGLGADLVAGGAGFDTVSYEERVHALWISLDGAADDGAPGENDNARQDVERVVAGAGNDVLTAIVPATLEGGGGDDRLMGGTGDDTLLGGAGFDRLEGGGGDDTLAGGGDDDRLDGGHGDDLLEGTSGADRLYGGLGSDRLFADSSAGPGDATGKIDRLHGEAGDDTLVGGNTPGDVGWAGHRNILRGGAGDDHLTGWPGGGRTFNELDGGPGDDVILNAGQPDGRLNGGPGRDFLQAREGHASGGSGIDTFSLMGCAQLAGAPLMTIDLGASHTGNGFATCIEYPSGSRNNNVHKINLEDFENIRGSDRPEILRGGIGVNIIEGNGGDDVIDGRGSNDRLFGGAGADRINGGQGDDEIVGGPGADRIFGDGDADLIEARDGSADTVDCGSGKDRVFDDAVDALANCEVTTATSLLLAGRR